MCEPTITVKDKKNKLSDLINYTNQFETCPICRDFVGNNETFTRFKNTCNLHTPTCDVCIFSNLNNIRKMTQDHCWFCIVSSEKNKPR